MRTIIFLLAFMASAVSSNAQITYGDLMTINKLHRGLADIYPDSYRKAHDFLLSKGMRLANYSIGAQPIEIGNPRPPQPPNLRGLRLEYVNNVNAGAEFIVISAVEAADSAGTRIVEYTTQLSSTNFQQYVQWRLDALSALAGIKDLYSPGVDIFKVPIKNGTSSTIMINPAYTDERIGYRKVAPGTYYLVIKRTTVVGSATDI